MTQIPTNTPEVKKALTSYVLRIEKVLEELDNVKADLRDIYAEAKGNGYDTKALRKVVQLRAQHASQVEEESFILATYARILDVPLYTTIGE